MIFSSSSLSKKKLRVTSDIHDERLIFSSVVMEVETVETVRQNEYLRSLLKNNRRLLENRPENSNEIYVISAEEIVKSFQNDFSKIFQFVQMNLHWPLAFKRILLENIRNEMPDQQTKLNNFADFVFNSTKNLKNEIQKPGRRFRSFFPFISSIERQYGSAVGSIFHLEYLFFMMNFIGLIVWLGAVVIPYKIFGQSTDSTSNFDFTTIFTTKGFLSSSLMFQSFYKNESKSSRYDSSLIYLLTSYFYFFIWFLFLTIRYASTYREKVLKNVLNSTSGVAFLSTFGRFDFTIRNSKRLEKHRSMFERSFRDLVEDDERIRTIDRKQFKRTSYRFKISVTMMFYIVLALAMGGINWIILHFCGESSIDCTGSLLFMILINRLLPYAIVGFTQIEQYKYLSYKLDAVAFRCVFLYISTVLSQTIYFFVYRPSCYENVFGQFIYILLLGDSFASLVFPVGFGLLFDFIGRRFHRDFDGINVHVQLTPPMLLYGQFLIWFGTYFSPLISILMLLNLFFSLISHRFYLFIRSFRKDSSQSVYIWNSQRLEYNIYLLGYLLLIISVTGFVVFTTKILPSVDCGPFSSLNGTSSGVIGNLLENSKTSVLWISLINFITSPGLTYFLAIIFFVVVYKYRKESLAEKQLVFIRQSSLESKKKLRKTLVKRLQQEQQTKRRARQQVAAATTTTTIDESF